MTDQTEFRTGVISPVECYKEGWQILKPHFWILFAITIVGMLIGGATFYVLLGAMICGIFFCYLQAAEGIEPKIDALFKGMQYIVPGLFVAAVLVVPTIVVIFAVYVPLLAATIMGQRMSPDELYTLIIASFAVEFVLALIMVCAHTLLLFAFPLIIDKELSGWAASNLSARAVWNNLQGVAGLWVIGFFVTILGYLMLCIGIYFVVPLIIAANVVAYRKVFPGSVAGRFEQASTV